MPASPLQQFLGFFTVLWTQSMRGGVRWLTPLLFYAISFVILGAVAAKGSFQFTAIYPIFSLLLAFIVTSMGLPQVFQDDYRSGVIEGYVAHHLSLEAYGVAAVLVYWLTQGLPLCFLTMLFGWMNGLEGSVIMMFAALQGFVLLIFCFLSSIAAAFSLELRGKSVLLGLLVFPLSVPALLLSLTTMADPFLSYVSLLFGLLLITTGISIVGTGFGLRLAVE